MSISQIQFIASDKNKNLFFATIRQKVDAYFKENNLSKHYNRKMVIKTVVLITCFIAPFSILLITKPDTGLSLFIWGIMGFAMAGVGMSVMHDANHGAYSSNNKINYWLGHTLSVLVGGSVFNWKLQHNILHHTYTNIVNMDDDIDDKLVMRFSPHTPIKWYHKFQFIYAFLFYSILTLYWTLLKDFVQFHKYKKNGVNKETKKNNKIILTKIILSKTMYFFLFILMPVFILKMPAFIYLCGYLLMHAIAGVILTITFQLAHTIEGTTHPLPDKNGTIENNWAIHQMNTTVNFSVKNKFISWYVGGLNFQIEHHLFPAICHIHYPKIAQIVKNTSEEYGIPYLENKTLALALKSHIRTLRRFGKLPPINEAIS